jgi:hypothetical protein
MARPINKLPKIERPKAVPEMKLETIPVFATTLELNLTNLEPYSEAEMNVNIDLGLDQIEEREE